MNWRNLCRMLGIVVSWQGLFLLATSLFKSWWPVAAEVVGVLAIAFYCGAKWPIRKVRKPL